MDLSELAKLLVGKSNEEAEALLSKFAKETSRDAEEVIELLEGLDCHLCVYCATFHNEDNLENMVCPDCQESE